MPTVNTLNNVKEKTLAVTGHRTLNLDFSKNKLKERFVEFIEQGFDTFLIGMAIGFDTVCFQTLEKLKKDYHDIKLIACVPCETQAEKFSMLQKIEYKRMLSVADQVIVLSKEYTNDCMQKRNMFMVDNSSLLFAYLKRTFGGTANTVRYAKRQGIEVVKY